MRPFFIENLIKSAWLFSFVYNKERSMWHWSNVIWKRIASSLNERIPPDVFIILMNLFYTYFRENWWEREDNRVLDTYNIRSSMKSLAYVYQVKSFGSSLYNSPSKWLLNNKRMECLVWWWSRTNNWCSPYKNNDMQIIKLFLVSANIPQVREKTFINVERVEFLFVC